MKVVLLGAPGVGKGTAAKLVAPELGLEHISTGDIFRAEMASGSELGEQVKEFVSTGRLVPDELVTQVISQRLEGKDNFLLDGYPRTMEQAKAMREFASPDAVLFFDAPTKFLIERTTKRAAEEGREDDDPGTVMRRIEEYREKTQVLVDYYRNEDILHEIDSTQDVEGVANQCRTVLKTLGEK